MACDVRLAHMSIMACDIRKTIVYVSIVMICVLLRLSTGAKTAILEKALTSSEAQAMLDLHNNYRSVIALGLQSGQQPAANMIALEWDDRQARTAQGWADQCVGGHNVDKARQVKPYIFIGQDYAGNYSPEQSVKAWFDEVKDYDYDKNRCKKNRVCGHYTEVVWAKARFIGCGQNKCSGKNSMAVVYCDYAPGGNVGHEPPYEKGPACSKCPAGYAFCLGRALCASLRACSHNGNKCRCTIAACKNGGRFNRATCFCTCPDGYMGRECQDVCEDTKTTCGVYKARGYCEWNSKFSIQMRKKCKKSCGWCQYRADCLHVNEGHIHPNTPTGKVLDGPSIALSSNHRVASPFHHPPRIPHTPVPSTMPLVKKAAPNPVRKESVFDSPATNTSFVGPPARCVDNFFDRQACVKWAAANLCVTHKKFMFSQCARSCNYRCQHASRKVIPVWSAVPCTAAATNLFFDSAACDKWAADGNCVANARFMRAQCAKSCNLCNLNHPATIHG
ncbi:multiple epidermal growth factor-like domains protein 6 isoform X1 [Lineus longissimus]|uniref:multiple epidermal growth factor-like domains protein 6 isoform X1 n=1 Tax=Lineus longissimus TaxID=88925 RepID=UPI00315D30E5